jgi:hypothetical protein
MATTSEAAARRLALLRDEVRCRRARVAEIERDLARLVAELGAVEDELALAEGDDDGR